MDIRRFSTLITARAAGLLATALAALAISAPAALSDETIYGVFWQSAPSHWREAGKRLYGEEIGKTVGDADVLVAWLDVNEDTIGDILVYPLNPKLCGEPTCEPRLYSFVNDRYHERIAGLGDDIKVFPTNIEMSPWRYGIYRTLKFDGSVLYWDGSGHFAKMYSVAPSTIDNGAFFAACSASTKLIEEARTVGVADPAAAAKDFCGCVAYQLTQRQIDQKGIDRLAKDLDDSASYRLKSLYSESDEACRIINFWRPWPQPGTFPARNNDTGAFYDACSRQEWVIDSSRVGSPHRAMALCGCVAEGLATSGLPQTSIDFLAQLYRDEITEEEIAEQDADVVQAGDTLSETCINQLRHADYVNGVDRPGSPKPFVPDEP